MAGLEGLLTPQTTEGTTTVDGKKTSTESSSAPKTGPSLFDSMLAQVGTKEGGETSVEGEVTKQQTSTGNTQTNVGKTTANGEAKAVATTAKSTTGGSLFDQMVSESKQQVSTTPTQTSTTGQTVESAVNSTAKTAGVQTTEGKTVVLGEQKNATATQVATVGKKTYTVSPTSPEEVDVDATLKAQKTAQTPQTEQIDTKVKTTVDTKSAPLNNGKKVVSTGKENIDSSNTKESVKTVATAATVKTDVEKVDSNIQKQTTGETTTNNSPKPESSISKSATNSTNTDKKITSSKAAINENVEAKTDVQNIKVNTTNNTPRDGSKTIAQDLKTNNADVQKIATTATTTVTSSKENNIASSENLTSPKGVEGQNVASKPSQTISTTAEQKTEVLASKTSSINVAKENPKVDSQTSTAKKSLADNLISTATATALADKTKAGEKGIESSLSQNITEEATKINTPLNNVNITSKDTVLSDGKQVVQKDIAQQGDTKSPINKNIVQNGITTASVETKVSDKELEVKTAEQNTLDKKIKTKDLDIKAGEQKHQLNKLEVENTEKTNISSATTTSNANSSNTTNQELAAGLATIRDTSKGEVSSLSDNSLRADAQKNISKKDDLLNQNKKQDSSNSLLDKMVKDASGYKDSEVADDATLGTKDQFVQKDLPLFAQASYLNDQKRRNDIANMMKKSEGVKEAQNAKNVSDIKKSATTLGLNATETQVIEETVQKEEARVQNTREDMLKRLAFDNNVGKKLHNNTQQVRNNETIVTKAANLTDNTEEKVVEVAVSNEAAQTIENRIIGARQTLRTMMSDVARQMAQNYRPPLTAFRINLNPSGLGNIAVMLKSEQNNGISISLNMSNTNTHDTLVDNQAALRAALTRNFDNTNSFSLSFGMQQDSNSSGQNQDSRSNQNSNSSDNSVVSANNTNQETTEEVLEQQANYM